MGAINPYLTRAMTPDGSQPIPQQSSFAQFMQAPQYMTGGDYRKDGKFGGGDLFASIVDPSGGTRWTPGPGAS